MARTIELKTIKQEGVDFEYRDALKQIVMISPQGETYEEMRPILKIMELLDEADDTLTLDASDYRLLVEKVKAHRWPTPHKVFLQFVDDIIDAPQEKKKPAPKARGKKAA